jgi:C terminal of Calcineurin-like phosphoesterase
MHIPLRNYVDPKEPAFNTVNRPDFLKLISGRPNTVSLAGHTHTTEHHYFGAEDGFVGPSPHHHHVMTAVSGSWWSGPYDHRGIAVADSRDGSPNGFHILSIDGQSYSTRFQAANDPNWGLPPAAISAVFSGSKEALGTPVGLALHQRE